MAGRKRGKKAIVGIEAAIVLIAFVIVAAALAFVVLNMGMFTTQRSKEVMNQALNEASSALEVDGSVMAYVDKDGMVAALFIPLKISPGQQAVDLSPDKVDVAIRLPNGTFTRINAGQDVALPPSGKDKPVNLTQLYENLDGTSRSNSNITVAKFYMVQSLQSNSDVPAFKVLEVGEKALLVIYLPANSSNVDLRLGPYQSFTVEIRPLAGAPLTIERIIPPTLPINQTISLI